MDYRRPVSAVSAAGLSLLLFMTPVSAEQKKYEDFNGANFSRSTVIDNQWFPPKPGTRLIWDGTSVDEEGAVEARSVVFTVTDLTKVVDGVRTVVGLESDYIDGELEEGEIVFFAQDNSGAVWQLGQYPEEYSDGKVVATPCWLHAANGKGGIYMPANPKPGDPSFSQGWAPTVPYTDRAVVHKAGEKVTVRAGTYDDVLVFAESSEEEPDTHQLKFYARGVGKIKVGWMGQTKTPEELELIQIQTLSAEDMAKAREAALKLEKGAYKNCKDVFGKTKPIEAP
jgi:hypothetical protein